MKRGDGRLLDEEDDVEKRTKIGRLEKNGKD